MLSNFDRSLEMVDRLETNSIRMLYYDLADNFSGIYKSYEYSRLCTIIEGEKTISIDNKETFKYDSSRYLLLPPDSSVHMTIDQPTKAIVFELDAQLIKQVNEKVSEEYSIDCKLLSQNDYFVGSENKEVKDVLNRIIGKSIPKGRGSEFLIDLYAQELVYHLICNKGSNQALNFEIDNPVYKAIQYMNANWMRPVSIKQLSYDLNMCETNFCQHFKKITGMTPNSYLTDIKLEKAKCLLKQTNVTEVAFDLGYENISYFISLFKKRYGITPKQYQKMN